MVRTPHPKFQHNSIGKCLKIRGTEIRWERNTTSKIWFCMIFKVSQKPQYWTFWHIDFCNMFVCAYLSDGTSEHQSIGTNQEKKKFPVKRALKYYRRKVWVMSRAQLIVKQIHTSINGSGHSKAISFKIVSRSSSKIWRGKKWGNYLWDWDCYKSDFILYFSKSQ